MEPEQRRDKSNRIRLILLEQNALLRTSLSRLLASEPDFELVGECAASREALDLVRKTGTDVVLLDFDAGADSCNEFLSAAAGSVFSGRFLVMTTDADARTSAMALKLGASGVFLKSEAASRLVHAIRMVANGVIWIDQKVIRLLVERYPLEWDTSYGEGLKEREQEVLQGIMGGLSNRKIGDQMDLSESSVKAIVQRLFKKAGVRTRSQLVRIALERWPGSQTACHS
ncbi:MAG: response regulator transcription factor [Bryobacteraceae bacterium]